MIRGTSRVAVSPTAAEGEGGAPRLRRWVTLQSEQLDGATLVSWLACGQAVPVGVGVRYAVGEGVTAIDGDVAPLLAGLPSTPVELCAVAQGLVMLPNCRSPARWDHRFAIGMGPPVGVSVSALG